MTPEHIGRYEIERRLGGGGMAEVFLAKLRGAEGFSRRVAIKRVLPNFTDHPEFAALFIREAQLCAQLQHPNVVSVLDFERDAERGLFLVMELVEGKDLSQLLAAGRVPISLAIFLAVEVLRGLGYAHHLDLGEIAGLVHRDVSPQNVLLSWDGGVKVSDFGIAKARAATLASESVVVKGKLLYMSPEQANGQALDGRSDLFAVGIMLWEMLVGRILFQGGTSQEMLAAVFFAAIPPPSSLRPEIPEDVSRVVMQLLERDLTRRYATAEEAIRDLTACRDMPRDGRAELVETLRLRFADDAQRSARSSGLASMLASSPFAATTRSPSAPASPSSPPVEASLSSLSAASHPTILAPSTPLPAQAPSSRRSPLRLFATFAVALVAAALATAAVAALLPRRGHTPAAGELAPAAGPREPTDPAPPASRDAPPASRDARPTTAAEPQAGAASGPTAPPTPQASSPPPTPATGRPARRPAKQSAPTGFVDVNFGAEQKGTP